METKEVLILSKTATETVSPKPSDVNRSILYESKPRQTPKEKTAIDLNRTESAVKIGESSSVLVINLSSEVILNAKYSDSQAPQTKQTLSKPKKKKEMLSIAEMKAAEKKIKKEKREILEKAYYSSQITYNDILAIKPLPFQDLFNKVPKPAGALIENGLPSWNNSPVDAKLHVIPLPQDACIISRGKLGETLWKSCDGGDFVFYDPYGYEVFMPYEPVHDKHLKCFFESEKNLQPLRTLQLVNVSNDAACSMKEFNMFRKYLYKLYSEALKNEYNRKAATDREEAMVRVALNNTRRDIQRELKREIMIQRRKVAEEARRVEARLREDKLDRRRMRFQEVQRKKEIKKQEDILKAEYRNKVFRERIQQRVVLAAEIELQRKVEAMIVRRVQDLNLKKKLESDRRAREKEREEQIEEHWVSKIRNQNFGLKKEADIREMREKLLKTNAKKRLKKNEMQLNIRNETRKQIVEAVTMAKEKKYKASKRKAAKKLKKEQTVPRDVPKTVQHLVDRYKKSVGRNHFVETEGTQTEEKIVPKEVVQSVIEILNETIKIYIKKKVVEAVDLLIQNAINLYESLVVKWKKEKYSSLVGKRQSLMVELSCTKSMMPKAYENFNLNASEQDPEKRVLIRLVSFADLEVVGYEDLPDVNSKSIRDRMPTPSPSEDTLSIYEHGSEEMHLSCKAKLELLIFTLCQKVLDTLETRILGHFFDSGDVASLSPPTNMEAKQTSLVNYIVSTFIFVVELVSEIDEDECIGEISRFIAKHILLL